MTQQTTSPAERANLREVETLYDSNYRDIAAMMRKVADEIEAGEYGDAKIAVFAIAGGSEFASFTWGPHASIDSAIVTHQAAAQRMIAGILRQTTTNDTPEQA